MLKQTVEVCFIYVHKKEANLKVKLCHFIYGLE